AWHSADKAASRHHYALPGNVAAGSGRRGSPRAGFPPTPTALVWPRSWIARTACRGEEPQKVETSANRAAIFSYETTNGTMTNLNSRGLNAAVVTAYRTAKRELSGVSLPH